MSGARVASCPVGGRTREYHRPSLGQRALVEEALTSPGVDTNPLRSERISLTSEGVLENVGRCERISLTTRGVRPNPTRNERFATQPARGACQASIRRQRWSGDASNGCPTPPPTSIPPEPNSPSLPRRHPPSGPGAQAGSRGAAKRRRDGWPPPRPRARCPGGPPGPPFPGAPPGPHSASDGRRETRPTPSSAPPPPANAPPHDAPPYPTTRCRESSDSRGCSAARATPAGSGRSG